MPDSVFIDTNILIYLYSSDEKKKRTRAQNLLKSYSPIISTQVLNELSNVLLRKFNISPDDIAQVIDEIMEYCDLVQVTVETIQIALKLVKNLNYSYFDSLIIASALNAQCTALFSEDLHHSHKIEDQLEIINPFK